MYENNKNITFNQKIDNTDIQPITSEMSSMYDTFMTLKGGESPKKEKEELQVFLQEVANDPASLQTLNDIQLFNELNRLLYPTMGSMNNGQQMQQQPRTQAQENNSFKGNDYMTRAHDSQYNTAKTGYKPYGNNPHNKY